MRKEDMELRQERFQKLGEIWVLLKPVITSDEESRVKTLILGSGERRIFST